MERLFGGGIRKKSVAIATSKQSKSITKGEFKLHTTKDPLPLLTKKQLSRDMNPKAKFLTATGADVARMKNGNSKNTSIFATHSFVGQPTAVNPPKKSGGFKFTKFQLKSKDENLTNTSHTMKTPVAIASTKPFLCDFSDKGLRKTALHTTNAAVKELLLKNGESQFVFRADTQSFASKKRKIAHEGANNASLPFKIGRATGKFGLVLNRTIPNKEKGKDVISEACIGKAKLVQVASKISETSVKQDDNVVSKKRGLLSAAAKAGPPLKKSKSIFQTALLPHNSIKQIESASPKDSNQKVRDDKVSSPRMLNPKMTRFENGSASENDVLLSTSTDDLSFTDDEIEDEAALKLSCTMDDDKEDEFLKKAATMRDFVDRLGLEQRKIRNRLLDAHADVSESLLDALTDLMAEEAGIGVEKLASHMDVDVDVNDPIVQDEIQMFQC